MVWQQETREWGTIVQYIKDCGGWHGMPVELAEFLIVTLQEEIAATYGMVEAPEARVRPSRERLSERRQIRTTSDAQVTLAAIWPSVASASGSRGRS